jgi:hypothetical protein
MNAFLLSRKLTDRGRFDALADNESNDKAVAKNLLRLIQLVKKMRKTAKNIDQDKLLDSAQIIEKQLVEKIRKDGDTTRSYLTHIIPLFFFL